MYYNYIMKFSQLRSSEFHYIKNFESNVTLGLKVDVYTKSLSIPELSEDRLKRLKLISDLSDEGLTNRQISDLFNSLGIQTPRGESYTPKNIWVTLLKWRKREHRWFDTYSITHPPKFYLRTFVGLKLWKK